MWQSVHLTTFNEKKWILFRIISIKTKIKEIDTIQLLHISLHGYHIKMKFTLCLKSQLRIGNHGKDVRDVVYEFDLYQAPLMRTTEES